MKPSLKRISLLFIGALLWSAYQGNYAFGSAEGTIDIFSGKPCYRCHLSKVSGPVVHSAIKGTRCTPCHKLSNGNHQAEHRFSEVKDRTARLCYECHIDQSNLKSVHSPIISYDCLGCHAPHVSTNDKLLRTPLGQLCFECHKRTLMIEENTKEATGFRDGTRNLHYLHVQKSAIPCLTCHQAHASSQDHLLRTKTGSGETLVTLIYQATSSGGSCVSSCHDTTGYVRQ